MGGGVGASTPGFPPQLSDSKTARRGRARASLIAAACGLATPSNAGGPLRAVPGLQARRFGSQRVFVTTNGPITSEESPVVAKTSRASLGVSAGGWPGRLRLVFRSAGARPVDAAKAARS